MTKSNDALNEQIKSNLTPEQLQELKDFYVERLVDNMSTNDLVFQAFKNYRLYMTKEQEVLSEKILDDLFYPEFDKLSTDLEETVTAAEEALANEPEINGIKSLNFRSNSFGKI